MAKVKAADNPFSCREITRDEAEEIFADQPYKLELVEGNPEGKWTVYEEGDFIDFCRGPHVCLLYTSRCV